MVRDQVVGGQPQSREYAILAKGFIFLALPPDLTFLFPAAGKPCVLRRKGTVTGSGVPGLSPSLADLLTGNVLEKVRMRGSSQGKSWLLADNIV